MAPRVAKAALRIGPSPLYLRLNRKGDVPMTEELLYDIRDGIGHVTFNRPQARNALTFPMYERLAEIAASPGDARALIITGAGDARFGFPIARTLGNCLSMSNLARLSALIGPARVIEMIFTARLFSAAEALSAGLVTEVLADRPALQARAEELARLVAGHAPVTLRVTKEALCRMRDSLPQDEDLIRLAYTS